MNLPTHCVVDILLRIPLHSDRSKCWGTWAWSPIQPWGCPSTYVMDPVIPTSTCGGEAYPNVCEATAIPRSMACGGEAYPMLSNDRTMSIRNKKTVGTRKHNSEATKSAQHAKDSDGPSDEHPTRNTRGTSPSMGGIDDTLSNQPDGRAEWYDDVAQKVEPRSYRSVLLNE